MTRLFAQDRILPLFRPLRSGTSRGKTPLAVAILFGLLCLTPRATQAQSADIAAVVNDSIVSVADVQARISLILASSNIPDSPDIRAKVAPQVIHQLIDEQLELQEAKKQDVSIPQTDIDGALVALEKQNGMPPGGVDKFLAHFNIPKSTLVDQIKAELTWARLVRSRYGPSLLVGDNDIADAKKQMLAQQNLAQNRVAEIFLPVDSPAHDGAIRDGAERLVAEIEHGARFTDVARQFSQSPSAAVGGDLGWVAPGLLAPDMQ